MSTHSLDETKAVISAIQLKITAAKRKVEIAEERLEKAIADGNPDRDGGLLSLLKSATVELTRLGQKETKLIDVSEYGFRFLICISAHPL
jgi:hypothetical protein